MSNFIIEENKYNTLTGKFGNTLIKYEGDDEVVSVPDGVTVIDGAFCKNTTVKKIILPNSVLAIDCYSFQGCVNLEEVVFSENLTLIRPYAFDNCPSLKILNFPDSFNDFDKYVSGFESLESLRFPHHFDENIIARCPKLKSIEFSANVKTVNINQCNSLDEIILPDSVFTLHLVNCDGIKKIKFSSAINTCSIENCGGIKDIIFPNGIATLVIKNCSALESIYIPKSVVCLGSDMFNGMKDGLNISYGGSFEDWQKLIKDRETYEGNGPNQNQYHYLGELSWIMYAPNIKTESIIHGGFKYNLKCNK